MTVAVDPDASPYSRGFLISLLSFHSSLDRVINQYVAHSLAQIDDTVNYRMKNNYRVSWCFVWSLVFIKEFMYADITTYNLRHKQILEEVCVNFSQCFWHADGWKFRKSRVAKLVSLRLPLQVDNYNFWLFY